MDTFISIKEINWLLNEISRLLSEGMLRIYYLEKLTFSKLQFSRLKNFILSSVFGELQLTQIWLNFQNVYFNLKVIVLGEKLCVAFLLVLFWKELWRFKVKKSMHFVQQKWKKFHKKETESKRKNPHTVLERRTLCFSL